MIIIKIICKKCGKKYDDEKTEICPKCGAIHLNQSNNTFQSSEKFDYRNEKQSSPNIEVPKMVKREVNSGTGQPEQQGDLKKLTKIIIIAVTVAIGCFVKFLPDIIDENTKNSFQDYGTDYYVNDYVTEETTKYDYNEEKQEYDIGWLGPFTFKIQTDFPLLTYESDDGTQTQYIMYKIRLNRENERYEYYKNVKMQSEKYLMEVTLPDGNPEEIYATQDENVLKVMNERGYNTTSIIDENAFSEDGEFTKFIAFPITEGMKATRMVASIVYEENGEPLLDKIAVSFGQPD